MKGEYLVAQLSAKASQVLLSLLLVRERETCFTQAEFATRTALSRRSISEALAELKVNGLVTIIPRAGRSPLVQLNLEYFQDDKDAIVPIALLAPPPPRLPPGPDDRPGNQASDETYRGGGAGVQGGPEGAREDNEEVPTVRERHGPTLHPEASRIDQVAYLQAVWDEVFPRADYPYQRLTQETAKRWLVGRSAEDVETFIRETRGKAKGPIPYPRGYIDKAFLNAKAKQVQEEASEVVIDDNLRRLTELGRRQYSGKKA